MGPGAWGEAVLRTLRVGGAFPRPRGAAPRCPPARRGSPFLPRNGEKEERGKPLDPGFMARSLSFARFGDRCLWYDSGAVSSGMPRPIWDAFSRENMLESMFVKEGFQIGLISPKAFPSGEGGPAKPGRMRGRPCTQPFLVESLSGSRQSPQRNFSPAPLGKSIAPSSVTFGDSFPPRGSLWVVQPYPKKRPKSGHADGHRNSPSTGTMWYPTPKRASANERAIKEGGPGGAAPGALSSGFLRRKPGSRPESGGNPRGRSGPAPVPTWPPCRPGSPPQLSCHHTRKQAR